MKSLGLFLTSLVVVSSCSQPNSPAQAVAPVSRTVAAPAVNDAPLVLSVRVAAHVVAADGILVVTLGIRNTGSEAIVLGTTSPLLLSVKDSQGEVVRELSLGSFPFPIDARQALSFTIEIPAPSEPGAYRLALRIPGRGETSPPCVVQIIPTRVGGEPSS